MSTRQGRNRGHRWRVIGLFLAPTLCVYVLLTVYPVVLTIYSSLFEIRPREPSTFVGGRHYAALATDRTFWLAVKHTAVWAIVAPVLEVVTGLLLALGLHARVPLGRLFRVVWFAPVLISYVVVAIMWSWLYNYDWGAVNIALRAVGLEGLQRSWLGEPRFALAALIVVDVWKWTPFHLVVCLAALEGLPREVLEAAALDPLRLAEEAPVRRRADDRPDPAGPARARLHRKDLGADHAGHEGLRVARPGEPAAGHGRDPVRRVDCHAHVIDPARFPYAEGPGYRPRADETGDRAAFAQTLTGAGVGHALLVQPSGYAGRG